MLRWIVAGCLACLLNPTLLGEIPPPRDLGLLEFRGNHAFSDGILLKALWHTPEVLAAAETTNSEATFLQVVRDTLHRGYTDMGYSNCQVSVVPNTEQEGWLIQIEEGKQTVRGAVRIDAPEAVQTFLQAAWDAQERSRSEPLWQVGKLWGNHALSKKEIQKGVDEWLLKLGYQSSSAQVCYENESDTSVSLALRFPPTTVVPQIAELDLSNTSELVAETLEANQISVGSRYEPTLKHRVDQLLVPLGLFRKIHVSMEPIDGTGRVRVKVKTVPLPGVNSKERLAWSRDLWDVWQHAFGDQADNPPTQMEVTQEDWKLRVVRQEAGNAAQLLLCDSPLATIGQSASSGHVHLKIQDQHIALHVKQSQLTVRLEEKEDTGELNLRLDGKVSGNESRLSSGLMINFEAWSILLPPDQTARAEEPHRIVWTSPRARLVTTKANAPIDMTTISENGNVPMTMSWETDIDPSIAELFNTRTAPVIFDLLPDSDREQFNVSPATENYPMSLVALRLLGDAAMYPHDSDVMELMRCFAVAETKDRAAAMRRLQRYAQHQRGGPLTALAITHMACLIDDLPTAREAIKRAGQGFGDPAAVRRDFDLLLAPDSKLNHIANELDPVGVYQCLVALNQKLTVDNDAIPWLGLANPNDTHGDGGWKNIGLRLWGPVIAPLCGPLAARMDQHISNARR